MIETGGYTTCVIIPGNGHAYVFSNNIYKLTIFKEERDYDTQERLSVDIAARHAKGRDSCIVRYEE